MLRAAVVTLSAAALLVAGCGGTDPKSSAAPSGDKAMKEKKGEAMKGDKKMATAKATTVKVVSSQFGRIVADGRGQAYYLFAREKSTQSQCYGECANKWPPALAKGKPGAGAGGRGDLLGTTRRRDGKLQLTYAGHPMYYYEGDSPGQVLCHNVDEFGGLWLVVQPDGKPVR